MKSHKWDLAIGHLMNIELVPCVNAKYLLHKEGVLVLGG